MCAREVAGRRHMVDVSESMEEQLGAQAFAQIKQKYHGRILPADHRVHSRRAVSWRQRHTLALDTTSWRQTLGRLTTTAGGGW